MVVSSVDCLFCSSPLVNYQSRTRVNADKCSNWGKNTARLSARKIQRSTIYCSRSKEFHANLGHAIETIRYDYPNLLQSPPHVDILTKDVILRERMTADLHGKESYLRFFWALRFHVRIFCSNTTMQINSLFVDDERGVVHVRWRMEGKFRIVNASWILDGLCIYYFNADGLCYMHSLENTVPPKSTARQLFKRIRESSAESAAVCGLVSALSNQDINIPSIPKSDSKTLTHN
mmetsp:Transcript_217/g.379  ORF Transcript_217/g.379 Transcript_217/m.379 type:complete len:233 (+) Transcript_217:303-1001(+)